MNTVAIGAGISLAAGLLMGAVARPQLISDDRPEGPQILAGWTGVRSTGPFDDGATFASYGGQVPDYVLGTDWKKMLAAPTPSPPPLRAAYDEQEPPTEEVTFTQATYEEPPRAAPSYPSLGGGAAPASGGEPGGLG